MELPGRPPFLLTYEQAVEIRRRYRKGDGGQLAREFGIRTCYLHDVLAGKVHKPPEQRAERRLSMNPDAIRQRRYYARKRGELPPAPPRPARRVRSRPPEPPNPPSAESRPQRQPTIPPPDPRAIVRAAWDRRTTNERSEES